MYVFSKRPQWLQLVFTWRAGVGPRIWRRVLFVTAISAVVTFANEYFGYRAVDVTLAPFTIVALPLGIFLGFRNAATYDRFWEGRRQWGTLVNTSRSLAREWLTLTTLPDGEGQAAREAALVAHRSEVVRTLAAFPWALKVHLRGEPAEAPLARLLDSPTRERVVGAELPAHAVLERLHAQVGGAMHAGYIDSVRAVHLSNGLRTLADVQGACERIKSTPLPFRYSVLIHQLVALYCGALPFGIVSVLHKFTPVVVFLVSYAFFGLDVVGDELEDPFGFDPSDLPMNALARSIEADLLALLGERPPPPVLPVGNVLL